ncbi:MAG: ShlB/FhaC/HecB family hemolysin secretion/activation protein, partial [Rhabdochlamydiaceae bacterium]
MKPIYWTTLALTLFGNLYGKPPIEMEPIYLRLSGIALVDKPQTLQFEKGVSTRGITVPALDILKAKLESQFLQKGIFSSQMHEIEQTIKAHYESQGIQWIVIMIPEQEIVQGVVQIVVMQGVMGSVECRGNRWFSDALLKSYITQQKGEVVDAAQMLNDIAWMNRNPFRQTNSALKSGQDPMEINLQLITQDRLPLRFYVGADNTGTSPTGRARGFTGVTWGNVFELDHRFTYQYTTDSEFHRFQAHTFQYLAPLSWRHQLFVYGGVSWVQPDMKPFKSDGNSGQLSLRYTIPFKPLYTGLLNELTWGFDFKRMNNDLVFIGNEHEIESALPITFHEVNLTQGMLGYSFAKQFSHHRAKFDIEIYLSPAAWVADQSHRDYN